MTGPDLINNLLCVLLRFRKDLVAITADIQQMFYCFVVSEKLRNFLRFFWYENNDLRRFIALRGSVKEIRSDRGTNFVGTVDHLDMNSINVEEGPVHNFLEEKQTVWIFNPPHSLHMGGIWERMIGITRRILNSMILEVQSKDLTDEVLTTFLAEVCAIVNGRPIVPV